MLNFLFSLISFNTIYLKIVLIKKIHFEHAIDNFVKKYHFIKIKYYTKKTKKKKEMKKNV